MKKILPLFVSLAAACSLPAATSEIVGFLAADVSAGSEATFSVVVEKEPTYTGSIASIPSADEVSLSNAALPVLTGEGNEHYLLVTSGDREGLFAYIAGNTSTNLSLTFVSEDLGSVVDDRVESGDTVKVLPFWTLDELLPSAEVPVSSQVLLFDRSASGINKSASMTLQNFDGFGWFGGGGDGNTVLWPDESFVLRIPAGASYKFVQVGTAPSSAFRTVLANADNGIDQEFRFTTGLPSAVTLDQLAPNANPGDQILIFDNSELGTNKSASITVQYFDGFGWFGGGLDGSSELEPGVGFVYRKTASNGAGDVDVLVDVKPSYQTSE